MKIKFALTIAASLLLVSRASALSYGIDSFTVAGGSGTSTGGNFTLRGTIGQPDAGVRSRGMYSVAGGFWGADQGPLPSAREKIQVWWVGGQARLRITGIPGRIYYIERAHFVNGPWPERLAALPMPISGVVDFEDVTASSHSQSFYRTRTD